MQSWLEGDGLPSDPFKVQKTGPDAGQDEPHPGRDLGPGSHCLAIHAEPPETILWGPLAP